MEASKARNDALITSTRRLLEFRGCIKNTGKSRMDFRAEIELPLTSQFTRNYQA